MKKMTEDEAMAKGMSDVEIGLGFLDGTIEPTRPIEEPHGKLVELRQVAYHDIYVYEDGYERRVYIGD